MNAILLLLSLQVQVPAPTGYVNDFAGIIDPPIQQQMLAVIDEVRQKSRGEIVVVTLRDLGGRESIDVARDIGREWKVGAMGGPGDAARNAGVIVLMKPGARPGDGQADLAIATGRGAEGFLTDALSGQIRRAMQERAVQAGRYDAGLLLGAQLIAQAYAREFGFELSGASAPPPQAVSRRPPAIMGLLPLLVMLFFFYLLARGSRRRRPRGFLSGLLWALFWSGAGRRGGGWGRGGGWSGGGWGGGGGGFGGFGGGGGFSGGGSSGRF